MILCDAGPLLCLVDRTQPQHKSYVFLFSQIDKEPIVTTWACMAEAMHFALKKGKWPMQKQLLKLLELDRLVISNIQSSDYARLTELMEKYQDRPMDLADATLVLTAEKTGETRVLTLDSDFSIYRINGHQAFNIIRVVQ